MVLLLREMPVFLLLKYLAVIATPRAIGDLVMVTIRVLLIFGPGAHVILGLPAIRIDTAPIVNKLLFTLRNLCAFNI